MKKLIIASAVSALACNAYAADETSKQTKQMKMPAGPAHGSTGMVFTEGKFATNLKTIFVEKSDLYSGSDKIANSANKEMTSLKSNAIIRYGLGANFDVRMLVPYVDKSMSTKMADYDNSGLGDIRVLSRYQITSPAFGDSFFSTVGIGVELPTGSTDKSNLSDGLQNGDGSTDPIIEVGITKPLPNSRIDFSAMYVFNQEGDNNYEKGDQLTYNLGYSYLLHPKFMPIIELNGSLADKNVKNGSEVDNSGGHEIFLTPGFSSGISKKFKLFAGVGIPVYRDYNDSTAGTLGTDYRVTTKLSYVW
ncbi:transporter [Vibrio sp. JC009]|uniref:transporter n=1 Tax=Vibrio sp. JC009 TaxID=2912314 RepID=UPI0023B070C8|nr:transporter [Vibrio sp. JC009]WED23920.1 transporter [Vibrio sp. JC009]